MRVLGVAICLVLAAGAACTPTSGGRANGGDDSTSPSGEQPLGQGATLEDVRRLEREARALARTDGCTSSVDCRAAPLGAKACGGPRDHVVYCATTADTVALHRALAALERAERAYNEREGIVSDCMLVTEPPVEHAGGSCRAATASPAAPTSRAP